MLEYNQKNYEKILFVSFIFTSILLIIRSFNFYFNLNSFGGHEWYTAEWLIHYSFGFVRRGMFGSLIVNLPFESDQSLIFLTFFLHTLYILYLLILIFIFVKNKQNSLSYLLLFSPAFVFFHTTNYEAIFRKELLGLLAFSLIVFSYLIKFRNILFFTGVAIFVVAIFSAEYNLYFLLPILYTLHNKDDLQKKIKIIIFLLPTLLYFILYLQNLENNDVISDLICESIYRFNYYESFCSGAIKWLGYDIGETLGLTLDYYRGSQYLVYALYLLIPLIPLLFTRFIQNNLIYFSIFTVSYIPLFIISIDWGRHIYMYISTLTILYFSENDKSNNFKLKFFYVFCILFVTLNIPYYEASYTSFLNLNLFLQKLQFFIVSDTFSYFSTNYFSNLSQVFELTFNFLIGKYF